MPAVRDRGLIFITAVACLFICILFHAQGVPELICPPGIIEIGTSAVLICSSSTANATLQFTDPNGTPIQCDPKTSFCPKIPGYNASVLNETQTQLQVNKVKPSHGGNWTCKELGQPNDNKDGCSITVRQNPSCNIKSDRDATTLQVHETISLTVESFGFYCSAENNFTLQTGSVREFLDTRTHMHTTNATNGNAKVPIELIITESHFGEVRLIFLCHNEEINMTCRGTERFKGGKGFLVPVVLGTVSILIIISSILICIVKRNRKALRPSLEHHNTADDVSEGDSIELYEDPSVSLRDEALTGALRNVGEDDGAYLTIQVLGQQV
ncbi:uncharacterized protein LOC124256819 isoform X2 [Haliotis rubra]|nr:uncharacterized protein LOC124256819 isoform X2 [Haliotis rubra]